MGQRKRERERDRQGFLDDDFEICFSTKTYQYLEYQYITLNQRHDSTTESRRFASAVAAHDADAATHGEPDRHILEHQGAIVEVLEVQVCHLVSLTHLLKNQKSLQTETDFGDGHVKNLTIWDCIYSLPLGLDFAQVTVATGLLAVPRPSILP